MFELASRLKFRFDSPKGSLEVEDLWDLPLTSQLGKANLDDIAKALHKQLKSADEVASFVTEEKKTDEILQKKFDLVKHIIDVRKTEKAVAAEAKSKAEKKQRILQALTESENKEFEAKTPEELRAMLAEL